MTALARVADGFFFGIGFWVAERIIHALLAFLGSVA